MKITAVCIHCPDQPRIAGRLICATCKAAKDRARYHLHLPKRAKVVKEKPKPAPRLTRPNERCNCGDPACRGTCNFVRVA